MSYKKYVESKSKKEIIISLDNYKEELFANLSSLLLKPNEQILEFQKELSSSRIISKIEKPLKDFFKSEDFDEVMKSSRNKTEWVFKKMARKIDLAIDRIKNWENCEVKIEAIYPEKNWVATEAKVSLELPLFKTSFIYKESPFQFKIQEINENEDIPQKIKKNKQNLIKELNNDYYCKRNITLYATICEQDNQVFKNIQRDLSLGIKTMIPEDVVFEKDPKFLINFNTWSIRLPESSVYPEGSFYKTFEKETPILWIQEMENCKL